MKQILLTTCALVAIVWCRTAMAATAEVGKKAPDFMVLDTYGNETSLEDIEGRIVVLEWINHDCPFVRKYYDAGEMQKLQRKYAELGIMWYSVCSSASGKQGYMKAEKWNEVTKEKKAVPSAVLLDADGKLGKLYGAKTTPHMYVIDGKGILVYQGAIDDKPTPNAADLATAQNYVAAVLDALLEGEDVTPRATQPYGCSVKY